MPWSRPKLVELRSCVHALSFALGNLKADESGRLACSCGTDVLVTRKAQPLIGATDYVIQNNEISPLWVDEAETKSDCTVTDLAWWTSGGQTQDNRADKRPMLVVATEKTEGIPAALVVMKLNTSSKAAAAHAVCRLHLLEELERLEYTGEEPNFFRGLVTMEKASERILFAGTSHGQVMGFVPEPGDGITELELRYILKTKGILNRVPVSALAVDKSRSPYLAAADEDGNLAVWDSVRDWEVAYARTHVEPGHDFVTALGIRGQVLVCGYASGRVELHFILEDGQGRKFASVQTCTGAVSAIDIHPVLDLALIAGLDGRVSVIKIPIETDGRIPLVASFYLPASVLGAAFSLGRGDDVPDFTLSIAEREFLVHFDFVYRDHPGILKDCLVQNEAKVSGLYESEADDVDTEDGHPTILVDGISAVVRGSDCD